MKKKTEEQTNNMIYWAILNFAVLVCYLNVRVKQSYNLISEKNWHKEIDWKRRDNHLIIMASASFFTSSFTFPKAVEEEKTVVAIKSSRSLDVLVKMIKSLEKFAID